MQSNGYGKNFIKDLSSKTSNIRKLLKKCTKFKWSKECQTEFDTLKEEFSQDILLQNYNPRLKTLIHVDASRHGLSALLMQEEEALL